MVTASTPISLSDLAGRPEEFPDDRGTILIEAANHNRRLGFADSAIELLQHAVELGGEVGGLG